MDTRTQMLFALHGGVCGCADFWSQESGQPSVLNNSTAQAAMDDEMNDLDTSADAPGQDLLRCLIQPSSIGSPIRQRVGYTQQGSPTASSHTLSLPSHTPPSGAPRPKTPSGPTKLTCFFWYHGNCHRNRCEYEHQTHSTWPVLPPPGYVHREVCHLPLCPLKEGKTFPTASKRQANEDEQKKVEVGADAPTPPGPPKQTCFWWYHRNHGMECNTGDNCSFAHESHITWPIVVPGDFVHKYPCYLPLCPMSEGMKEVKSNASSHSYSESTDIAVEHSDCHSQEYDISFDEASDSESISRQELDCATNSSDSESSDSSTDSADEEDPEDTTLDPENMSNDESTSTSSSSSESHISPPSPEQTSTLQTTSNTPPMSPEGGIKSISHEETQHKINRSVPKSKQKPVTPPPPKHALPSKPDLVPSLEEAAQHHPDIIHKPPTAPKVSNMICWYWYHSGRCTSKDCAFAHQINSDAQIVRLPPPFHYRKGHDPNCQLELCPVRIASEGKELEYIQTLIKYDQKIEPEDGEVPQVPSVHQLGDKRKAHETPPDQQPAPKIRKTEQQAADDGTQGADILAERRERTRIRNQEKRHRMAERKRQALEANLQQQVPMSGSGTPARQRARPGTGANSVEVVPRNVANRRRKETSNVNDDKDKSSWFRAGTLDQKVIKEAKRQENSLVDYYLPEGKDRAEWDTDLVRRAFGEIV
ncbi:hypothetical protein BDV96DRAFT_632753 [Lophiotrema nucula]|uniref:C3H1-type domain-containing protein n=1 Tax=Lophiotrema nucula TaxID=690887 RepID=A0A6A5Z5E7_9PLEO|nr:hypothetical protein BDV96DRAFT_632753 [Lophiotrema nucula]